jgi:hypothetical protein
MSILMECKKIWPLAARWLEALEKFSRDPKASALSLENSMADGVRETSSWRSPYYGVAPVSTSSRYEI